MLATQYTIHLPIDYNMKDIEARVEKRKPLFDELPGLMHKSYLANYKEKLYAPFYIWNDITKLRDFLLDELFQGLTTDFSRPRVRSWAVLNALRGTMTDMPTHAVREADPIGDVPLEPLFEEEKARQQVLTENENLYLSVLGLDPDRWEILRYTLWKDEATAPAPHGDCVHTYRVLHV